MSISTEPGGTEQDWTVHVEGDTLIVTGTVTDHDGNAVDLTDCKLRLLLKADVDDADDDADAEGTVTPDADQSANTGQFTVAVSLAGLDPYRDYEYSMVVEFPGDYETEAVQGHTLPSLWGTIHARRQATRSAT